MIWIYYARKVSLSSIFADVTVKRDQEHFLNISNTFRTLVDDKIYADMMFVVPESLLDPKKTKTIYAHTYLAARCNFLKTQIENRFYFLKF